MNTGWNRPTRRTSATTNRPTPKGQFRGLRPSDNQISLTAAQTPMDANRINHVSDGTESTAAVRTGYSRVSTRMSQKRRLNAQVARQKRMPAMTHASPIADDSDLTIIFVSLTELLSAMSASAWTEEARRHGPIALHRQTRQHSAATTLEKELVPCSRCSHATLLAWYPIAAERGNAVPRPHPKKGDRETPGVTAQDLHIRSWRKQPDTSATLGSKTPAHTLRREFAVLAVRPRVRLLRPADAPAFRATAIRREAFGPYSSPPRLP